MTERTTIHCIIAIVIWMLACGSFTAHAQAPDGEEPSTSIASESPENGVQSGPSSLTFERLGYTSDIQLSGLFAQREFFVPSVRGTGVSAIELDVLPAPNMPPGLLTVLIRDRIQYRAAVPSERTTLRVPIADGQALAEALRIVIETAFEGRDQCEAYALYHLNILPSSRVIFDSEPQSASTIADFFPPFADRITYQVPDPPTPEASEAGLRLAGFLARRFRGLPPEIVVAARTGAAGGPSGNSAWSRTVIFEPGSSARLAQQPDGKTALVIGSVREAEQLFTAPSGLNAAVTSAFSADSIEIQSVRELGERVSLAQLGYAAHRVKGIGTIVDRYDFSLADFGGNRYPAGIRLVVRHSPLVEYSSGYMTVDVNDVAVEHFKLDGTTVDRYIRLPKHILNRDNEMEVRFEYSPPQGECTRGQLPFSATVDPGSTFMIEEGGLVTGLDAFPQSLLPTFDVKLAPNSVPNLQTSMQLVTSMQQTTHTALAPRVLGEGEESRGRGLLVVTDEPLAEDLDPVLDMNGFRLTDREGNVLLSFTPETPYHAIQAFEQGGRHVLVVGRSATGASALTGQAFVDELLRDEGWYQVHGDVAVRGPEGRINMIALRGDALQIRPMERSAGMIWQMYRVWIYLAAALLILLGFIWLYPKVVRSHHT